MKFGFYITIVFATVFSVHSLVNAQTPVICPVGYTCTPIPPQPTNCPVGYNCVLTTPVKPSISDNICYVFSQNLTIGSTGPDVVALQTWLIGRSFDIPDISKGQTPKGYFSESTRLAVRTYQISVGLPSLGFVGPLTRAKINNSCNTFEINKPTPTSVTTTIISSVPTITSISPTYGQPGTKVIIKGTGFSKTSKNYIEFNSSIGGTTLNAISPDGTTLEFTVPNYTYGSYKIYVSNDENGFSTTYKTFILTLPTVDSLLSVGCSTNSSNAKAGQVVSWYMSQSGGIAPYTYSWTGTDDLSGSGTGISKIYSTGGVKIATITATSGDGRKASGTCTTTVVPLSSSDITTVPNPIITVTSPNGDKLYHYGDTMPVQWSYSGFGTVMSHVDVYVIPQDGRNEFQVATNYVVSDNNNISLKIDKERIRPDGTKFTTPYLPGTYKIRVTCQNSNPIGFQTCGDTSDASFSITSSP